MNSSKQRDRRAHNAAKHGWRGVNPTIPGERDKTWRTFRDSVVADLGAVGAVEEAMAVQVAWLLWRGARVARAQTAVVRASIAALPREVASHTGTADVFAGSPDPIEDREGDLECEEGTLAALERFREGGPDETFTFDDVVGIVYAVAAAANVEAVEEGEPIPGTGVPLTAEELEGVNRERLYGLLRAMVPEDLDNALTNAVFETSIQIGRMRRELAGLREKIAHRTRDLELGDRSLLDTVERWETHNGRELSRALRELRKLQEIRASAGTSLPAGRLFETRTTA